MRASSMALGTTESPIAAFVAPTTDRRASSPELMAQRAVFWSMASSAFSPAWSDSNAVSEARVQALASVIADVLSVRARARAVVAQTEFASTTPRAVKSSPERTCARVGAVQATDPERAKRVRTYAMKRFILLCLLSCLLRAPELAQEVAEACPQVAVAPFSALAQTRAKRARTERKTPAPWTQWEAHLQAHSSRTTPHQEQRIRFQRSFLHLCF